MQNKSLALSRSAHRRVDRALPRLRVPLHVVLGSSELRSIGIRICCFHRHYVGGIFRRAKVVGYGSARLACDVCPAALKD